MKETKNLVRGAFFLALGLLVPYVFHLFKLAGPVFLPMHIPVLLAGFILGSKYGLMIGFICPLLNSVLTGMPPLFPVALGMAFELATYGFISGYLYKDKKANVFVSLVSAMIAGRFILAIANIILLDLAGKKFILSAFLTSSFVTGLWGIIIQLILIPIIIGIYEKRVN